MNNTKAIIFLSLLIGSIVWFNIIAYQEHLYFIFPHLDVVMHIAGGLWVGYGGLYLLQRKLHRTLAALSRIWYGILFAFGIGVCWEFLEFITNLSFLFQPHVSMVSDTASDILMDIIGGTLAGIFGKIEQRRHNS